MEDGDVQLSTLAQQPDSDFSVFLPPHSGLQAKDGEHQPPLAKQQKVHSDADKAYLKSKRECFPTARRCRR